MTGSSKFRSLAVALGALFVVVGCGGGGGGNGETLAADQTFRFGLSNDVTSLDPAHVSSAVDITFLNEVFTGLYRFDNNLKVQPDGASALPTISADGLTWTFPLRHDVVFSNGDKVTSADWVWSWTRTLRLNDAYASNLEALKGAFDVENGKSTTISGLSAPDAYTLKAQLAAPAGFWLTQLAMPTAAEALDQKAIAAGGGDDHWTENVIGIDDVSRVKKFESGGYDVVGMANNGPGPDDVLRYKNDPTKSKLLTIFPGARSTALGFNFVKGPFASKLGATPGSDTTNASDPGLDGRRAISMAIDRAQLTDIACAHSITCQPATGGVISKGLQGYLGDGADPYSKFDATAAKALYTKWDPTGSKVKGLELRYNSNATNDKVYQNVQSQLKLNLGIDVKLAPSDFPTLQRDRQQKLPIMGRESWGADYDHPQDWFDNLFTCAQAPIGKGNDQAYCNPAMDTIVTAADAKPLTQAVADYQNAGKMLVNDVVWATMFYGTQSYMIATYVRGAGYNSLYDYNWEGIRLLQH